MAETVTFDAWNAAETRRLCADDPHLATNIRKARMSGFARFTFWDDYLAHCATNGVVAEDGPA